MHTCTCINKYTCTYIVVFVFGSGCFFLIHLPQNIFTVSCRENGRNFNLHLQNLPDAYLKWSTILFTMPKVYKYSYLHVNQSWIILIAHQVFGLSWDGFWVYLSYRHVHNTILKWDIQTYFISNGADIKSLSCHKNGHNMVAWGLELCFRNRTWVLFNFTWMLR